MVQLQPYADSNMKNVRTAVQLALRLCVGNSLKCQYFRFKICFEMAVGFTLSHTALSVAVLYDSADVRDLEAQ